MLRKRRSYVNTSTTSFLARRQLLRCFLSSWRSGMALVGCSCLVVCVIWLKRVHDTLSTIRATFDSEKTASLFHPFWNFQDGVAVDGFPRGIKKGCTHWQGVMPTDLVKQELLTQPPPTGLVVTLLLGRNPVLEGAMCGKFFASQLAHFIQPHELDVLLVISPGYSDSEREDEHHRNDMQPSLPRSRLRECLSLTTISASESKQTWTNLDGSSLTTWEYRLSEEPGSPFMESSNLNRPTRIFLAESNIWNNTSKAIPRTMAFDPPACQAPVDYILGTRWYIDDMLHLAILQQYEYFIKLDPDVLFFKPLPYNILHDMKVRGAMFAHTAEYPPRGKSGSAQCAKDIVKAVQEFSHQVVQITAATSPLLDWNHRLGWKGVPCTTSPTTVFRNADRYYTNFIVGRTDFFQSNHVRALGQYLSQYPNGFFRHRWTDQLFWSMAMGLWVTEYDATTDHSKSHYHHVVADYTEFRCAPLRNCWLSSHDAKTFPDASNRCDNQGYFLHTKHVTRWETLLAGQSSPFGGGNPSSLPDEQAAVDMIFPGLRAPRFALPQITRYRHDCSGSRWG